MNKHSKKHSIFCHLERKLKLNRKQCSKKPYSSLLLHCCTATTTITTLKLHQHQNNSMNSPQQPQEWGAIMSRGVFGLRLSLR